MSRPRQPLKGCLVSPEVRSSTRRPIQRTTSTTAMVHFLIWKTCMCSMMSLLMPGLSFTAHAQESPVEINKNPIGKFLVLSDAHYDPFYGTPDAYKHTLTAPCKDADAPRFSTLGCGSSRALVRSVIANAQQVLPNPDFILFLGDATRHGASMVATNITDVVLQQTLGLVPSLVDQYYGSDHGIPIVSMPPMDLGNNDFLDDYTLDVTSVQPCIVGEDGSLPEATNDWLKSVSETYRSYFVSEEEAATFACGGYLVRQVTPKLAIIALNTVLWTNNLISDYSLTKIDITDPTVDPFGQHSWLNHTLATLQSQGIKAYVTGHVPPTLMSFANNVGEPLMYDWHVDQYYQTLMRYSGGSQDESDRVVAGQLFGHIHTSELRASPSIMDDSTNSNANIIPPIITTGSISPCFSSNPVFVVMDYDFKGTQTPTDLITYAAPLNQKDYATFIEDTTPPTRRKTENAEEENNVDVDSDESDSDSGATDADVDANADAAVDADADADAVAGANEGETESEEDTANIEPEEEVPVTLIQFEPEFDSLRSFFKMNGNNNEGEADTLLSSSVTVHKLASRMMMDSELWDRYGNHWHKGGVQQPECATTCRLKQLCLVACGSQTPLYTDCVAAAKDITIADTDAASDNNGDNGEHDTTTDEGDEGENTSTPPATETTLYQCTLSVEAYDAYRASLSTVESAMMTFPPFTPFLIAIISALLIISCIWCCCKWRKRRLIRQGMTRINEVYLEELDMDYDDNSVTSDVDGSGSPRRPGPSYVPRIT